MRTAALAAIAFAAVVFAGVSWRWHKRVPLRLQLLGALILLRHPYRTLRAWLRLHGLIRTPVTYFCPGCDYRTRRWPKVKAHECESLDRATRRRLRRYANRKGTVKV